MKISLFICLLLFISMSVEATDLDQNKQLVLDMIEAINQRDFDTLDALVAEDMLRHSMATPDIEIKSLSDFKAFLHQDLRAVPDFVQEVQQILAEGDRVAVRAIYRGTQTGPMGPFPASGRELELPFIGILRVENGKIAEIWVEWDNLAALRQLGHFPPPEDEASEPPAQ